MCEKFTKTVNIHCRSKCQIKYQYSPIRVTKDILHYLTEVHSHTPDDNVMNSYKYFPSVGFCPQLTYIWYIYNRRRSHFS